MATDADLQALVAQTLESRGILGKMRAELRASVFLALEDEMSFESPLENRQLRSFLETEHGMLVLEVVREFLDFFNLGFTKAVLDPELSGIKPSSTDRATVAKKLNLGKTVPENAPLLSLLIRRSDPLQEAGAFFSPSSQLHLNTASPSHPAPIGGTDTYHVRSSVAHGDGQKQGVAASGIASEAGTGSGADVRNVVKVQSDRDESSRSLGGVSDRSRASADSSLNSESSAREKSRSPKSSSSRSQIGSRRETSKPSPAATGSLSQSKYTDDDFQDSASQVSSIAGEDVADITLTGSGSDSSWLSRQAAPGQSNADTSDHSISQFSEGEFSYFEDVQP